MKWITLFLTLMLFHPSAQGEDIPKYSWCRDWIEKHSTTNAPSKDECVFIGHNTTPQYASLIPFRKGIGLREILDQTPYKKGTATIWIMHQYRKKMEPTGEFITVKPSDNPEFEVRPSDVLWIWIYEGDA